MVITSDQIEAGKALLRWSEKELARRATISITALRRVLGKDGGGDFRVSTLLAVETVLSNAGVEFLSDGGVRLRPPKGKLPVLQKKSYRTRVDTATR